MTAGKAELKARVCAEIDRRADDIVRISEHIMRHPESGFREVRTAQYVCGELDRMGLAYRSGLALTGVKARMSGAPPGRRSASLASSTPSSCPTIPTPIP